MLTLDQERFVDDVLDEYAQRDVFFSCFLELPEKLLVRHQFYDLCIVEYRGSAGEAQVWLNYRICPGKQEFNQVELERIAENLYLWHTRLLPGEQIEYFITEKTERMETVTERRTLQPPRWRVAEENRYGRLQRMVEAMEQGDGTALVEEMEQYQASEGLVNRLFRVR
jgi:hypothetical protein